jgi:hypothetical protein
LSKRKMLAAEEGVANKVAELAARRGTTVYQTVNDILEQALRVEEAGISLKEVVEERWMLEKAQEIGFTFVAEHLLYQVVDVAYSEGEKKLTEMWRDTGHWYGKYFQGKTEKPLDAFKEAMELLTFGASEFSFEKQKDDCLALTCVSEHFTEGFTEIFSLFIECVLDVLSYDVSEREVSKGIIRLRLSKRR